MAVRITSEQEEHQFVIHVHGILDATAAALLHAEAGHALPGVLVVDLSGLLNLDEAGSAALCALVAGGARIRGASPYVKLLLAAGAGAATRRAPPPR
ncbi:MAG: STAS domain-containing protein [Bacteroidales bacterium]